MDKICDVVVVGGSIRGCFTALHAAKAGAKVVLVEPGTFLGGEITSTLRPWLGRHGLEALDDTAKSVFFGRAEEESKAGGGEDRQEIPIYIGAVKKNLLALLRQYGVTVLFLSEIAGVAESDEGVEGILLGGKWGLYLLRAKTVIDATENKRVLRMAGEQCGFKQQTAVVRRVMEYHRAAPAALEIKLPESLGVYEDRLLLHPGKKEENQYFADFGLAVEMESGSYAEGLELEVRCRKKTLEISAFLKAQVPGFSEAVLFQTSPRLYVPGLFAIAGEDRAAGKGFVEAAGCGNLYGLCGESALPLNPGCADIAECMEACRSLGEYAGRRAVKLPVREPGQKLSVWTGRGRTQVMEAPLWIPEKGSCEIALYPLELRSLAGIPEIGAYDVVVAGGGTSGAPAAAAAAQKGVKTALVETFWGLGGTKTLGQVKAYYTGYRGGYTGELGLKINAMAEGITGGKDENHTESRMMVNLKEVLDFGGTVFFGSMALGAVMEGKQVRGVYILNSDGLGILRCKVAVDATGDGDLAVSAGAEYHLGAKRDKNVQTFNQNGYIPGSFNDLGIVDATQMQDVLRGIYVAHQRNDPYDFCPLLTVRESRRITGEYSLTMADILLQRCQDDTVSIALTDCDPHGSNSSLLARMGYMPIRVELVKTFLPYRICLPRGVEGLLMAAKALSGTKDAVQFFRMSADMQNLGYAVGTAAAAAVRQQVLPRDIDLRALQQILREKGILPGDMTGGAAPEQKNGRELAEALKNGCRADLLQVLLRMDEKLKALLEESYSAAAGEGKLLLAMALAWAGSATGTEILLEELERLYREENHRLHDDLHPVRDKLNPLAGFIGLPDIYWKINQLIVLLGLAGEKRAVGLLGKIALETEAGGEPYRISPPYMYGSIRIDWQRIPHYDRILSLCTALERLADPSAVPGLSALLEKPYIGGYISREDLYAGGRFMSAYLELAVARTLARCGGRKGALLLADYVGDVQAVLSGHAYDELKEITGQNFGKDAHRWKEWITLRETLPVKPYLAGAEELYF